MTTGPSPDKSTVKAMMRKAVADGVFPGAVLLVARNEEVLLHEAWGMADLSSRDAVLRETVFDLASLTKPLATTLAVMRLIQKDLLELETPMPMVLPGMEDTDKAGVTVRHLLSHASGWPAWQPFFERLRTLPEEERRPHLARYLAEVPMVASPGEVFLYSDLDFLALGLMVEACSGMRLDCFAREEIFRPLGIADLFFNPLDEPPAARRYAATEQCPWRGLVLRGAVHDDNAYALNGVAGHAGLFGTAGGVQALLQALLRIYRGEDDIGWLPKSLVQTMWTRVGNSGWTLGFDTPAARGSSSGRHFSANSVGHLGFTGTSFWLDLERGISVVLLTNRVHPSRSNVGIRGFRPRIHDAIMEWLLQSVP
jgi:CubicO group peptidase (beta-lactamase class C family)